LIGLGLQELNALGGAPQGVDGDPVLQRPGGRSRRLAQAATWRAVLRPRSSARNSSGAPTISALSWPMAATRAVVARRLVVSSARSASR
jgi:hypothetical protein